jgi:UDP-N-acetylmuramate--alanine ligase
MTVRSLHFLGAGGVGMCGLAEVVYCQGLTVSGCDLADSERTRHLQGLGVAVRCAHDLGSHARVGSLRLEATP